MSWDSPDAIEPGVLDTFPYEYPDQEIELTIASDEFTCVCPDTGLPDFATITIRYVPSDRCLELKTVKYYLMSYRSVGIFHEHVVNRILKDLIGACSPVRMSVHGDFHSRGGVHTVVDVKYERVEESGEGG